MGIDNVSKAIDRQIAAEVYKAYCEKALKEASQEHEHCAMRETPAIMMEEGVTAFTTLEGREVYLGPIVTGHLDKEDLKAGYAQIKKDGEEGIIRYKVLVDFPKGREGERLAKKAVKAIKAATGTEANLTLGVAANSFGAYLRRHYQDMGFPLMTLFSGNAGLRATIKKVK